MTPSGWSGAAAACRRGVRVRIIDRAASSFIGSRGKGLQERSLEVLTDLGVAGQLRTAGWSPPSRVFVNGHLVAELPPSGALILPQSIVEEALRARLAEFGVIVELDTTLACFEQSVDGVVATTSRGTIAARYLVGCDGGRSTVRKALGVGFAGSSSANASVVLGDVEVTGLSREYGHTWIDPQRGMLALTPFRTVPQWQLVAAAADVAEPSLDELRRQFDLFTGLRRVTIGDPTWVSSYGVNVRMTREYRVGRVFLAGDAAHVHPPAGGLGMNTGIQDAYNLGWKLARALAGTASPNCSTPTSRSVCRSPSGRCAPAAPVSIVSGRPRSKVPLGSVSTEDPAPGLMRWWIESLLRGGRLDGQGHSSLAW